MCKSYGKRGPGIAKTRVTEKQDLFIIYQILARFDFKLTTLIQDCIESPTFRVLQTGVGRQTIADEDRILEVFLGNEALKAPSESCGAVFLTFDKLSPTQRVICIH